MVGSSRRARGRGPRRHCLHARESVAGQLVQREQQLRLLRLQGEQRLPKIWGGQNELMLARLGQDDLKRVSESLPEQFSNNQLERQIQVALAAYQAGLSVSVSVSERSSC